MILGELSIVGAKPSMLVSLLDGASLATCSMRGRSFSESSQSPGRRVFTLWVLMRAESS